MLGVIFYSGTTYAALVIALEWTITLSVALSTIVSVDRLLHVLKYLQVKLRAKITGKTPESRFKFNAFGDKMRYSHLYPKTAVQLPMFNEKAVCQAVIDAACEMDWPKNRLIVQVLDDSTDAETRRLVDDKVLEWRERGVNCVCIRRTNREGYKAGALKEGLELLGSCDYVAVFDADFKPKSDFLCKTIPYLHYNDDVGYVQARWEFLNPEESYLTKAQEISLNYHMKCEQFEHFASGGFFNFNGTAGVWRRKCIEDVGGWNGRTTVEDMDLSLRAYVAGWKAVFLDGLTCLNELPSSFSAYRKQQHRWTCGPIQLWRRAGTAIWSSKIPLMKKLELNVMFFGIRKCASHMLALGFFCFLVPLSVFTPEVSVPLWALVHLPIAVTFSTTFFTKKGWLYSFFYVAFENAMSTVKLWAVINGMFDLGRAHEWVVTAKAGDKKSVGGKKPAYRLVRVYATETLFALFIFSAAIQAVFVVGRITFSVFLVMQGVVFFCVGFNMVDAGGPLGKGIGPFGQTQRAWHNDSYPLKEQKIPIFQHSSRI